MKKISLLLAFIITSIISVNNKSFGQNKNTPVTIQDCQGNTLRSADAFEKSAWFNAAGINLSKYDWSNPTINCHINEASKAYSKRLGNLYGAAGAAGGSIALISTGLIGHYPDPNPYSNTMPSRKISVAPLIIGVGLAALTYYLFNKSKFWKSLSQNHLTTVQDYFRLKGL